MIPLQNREWRHILVAATARQAAASEVLMDTDHRVGDLGTGRIEEGARNLLDFVERVDTDRCGAPAAVAVVTATGYGYQRPDGVGVIPVGSLGP